VVTFSQYGLFAATGARPAIVGTFLVVAAMAATAEAIVALRRGRRIYDRGELVATLLVHLGHIFTRSVEAGVVATCFGLLWSHRLTTLDATTPLGAVGLFLGYQFLYYWYHRAAHRVRWLWATHAVHHSATHLNLTAALRLGWTGVISGHFLFFAPLVWLGWSPTAVDLGYQFFVHTELVPSLGPLEWVLNTPRHHAVHHASNDACLDRNYGGMLIVFDRLFGTFAAPPPEPLRFGLVGHATGTSVVAIVFGEWRRLIADVSATPSIGAALHYLFGPPGGSVSPTFTNPIRSGDNA